MKDPVSILDFNNEIFTEIQKQKEKELTLIKSKEFSGQTNLRIPPDLHKELAILAYEREVSLNAIITQDLQYMRIVREKMKEVESR